MPFTGQEHRGVGAVLVLFRRVQKPAVPERDRVGLFGSRHEDVVDKVRVLFPLVGFYVVQEHPHPFALDGTDRLTSHVRIPFSSLLHGRVFFVKSAIQCLELGRALYHRGKAQAKRGQVDVARVSLTRALGIFQDCSAKIDAERTRAALDPLGADAGEP